jgi:glycosyltransferase involved in cell wall biosynthesis
VLAVAPFANPHVTCIYDALAAEPGLDVVRASLTALPSRRLALGWAEMTGDAPYLQPWRRASDAWSLRRELSDTDVAILPGPFHLARLPFDFVQRLTVGDGPILAWSERFLSYRERSPANRALLGGVARLLDSKRVHLLSVGDQAIADYRAIGVRRWEAHRFGFAVEPVVAGRAPVELPRAPSDAPLAIGFVGELIERKRVDLLLEALAAPGIASQAWTLDVVGDGPERSRLAAQATRLGFGARVGFVGAVDRDRARQALETLDVVVLPSRFEGWGAVVNEAMEAGVAVIASDAVGSARMFEPGRSGLVFAQGDAASLVSCLARLLADRGLVASIGAAGRAAVGSWRPAAIASRLADACRALGRGEPMPDVADGGPLSRIG